MEKYEVKFKDRILCENEISIIRDWFRKYYTEHEQKYRRLHFLGLTDDDGVAGRDKLSELYAEAETKRKRIQELESLLAESEE